MVATPLTSKPSIWFIFITILLDAIGIGLLIPVLPDVLRRFSSDPITVSENFGWFIGAYALMQFVASPILGSLSDRYGRKPILLVSLCGSSLDYLLMAFAPTLGVLFIGRVISGLTGASMTVASSYMADVSTEENRSANFGMIGAAWGVGFILGPMLGGLFGTMGPTAPFIAASILNSLNFVFGIFVLPESLPEAFRRRINVHSFNPFRSIFRMLRRREIFVLASIYFLLFVAGNVHPVNWTLYTQTKFHWSAWQVGMSLSFVGVVFALSQAFLTRLLIPKFGERRSIIIGIIFYGLGFLLYAIAEKGWMLYVFIVLTCLSGLAMPALQSMLTRLVPMNEQGELQGSLVSLGSVATLVAPALYTYLFVTFTRTDGPTYFAGAAYIGAFAICVLTLILVLLTHTQTTDVSA